MLNYTVNKKVESIESKSIKKSQSGHKRCLRNIRIIAEDKRGQRTDMLRVLFSISTILIAAWPSWSKAQNAKESTIVIKRTIKLAAAPSRLSLSPDGNRLAVHEFNNALVRIVDINTDSGPGTVVSTKVRPEVDIVWSEDSKRIAISPRIF